VNARTLTLPPAFVQWRAQVRQAWRARAPRERLALSVMALLVAALLVWLIFIQPAWRTLRDTPAG
jgi:general secretion pathway protein M